MAGTLSAFFDESGQEMKFEPDTKHYLLTIVLHDQGSPIAEEIAKYESLLSESSLPDVPFHFYDLCHARNGYEGLDFETRKRLFVRFSSLVRRLPITYMTFSYRRSEFADAAALSDRMCRALELIDRASPLIPQLQRRVSPRRVPEELPQRREAHVARGGRVATHVAKPAHPALQAALGEALPREAGRGDALRLADDGAPLHRPVEVLYASPL